MHNACVKLATDMYGDHPYAREVGHVAAAVGVTTSAGVMEGHDVPLASHLRLYARLLTT
jgi:hypothetical protein